MANTGSTIRIKHSRNTSIPTSLTQGELAYSSDSDRLYIGKNLKDGAGLVPDTIAVTEIGGGDRSFLKVDNITLNGNTIATLNGTPLVLAPVNNTIGIATTVSIVSTPPSGGGISQLTLDNDKTVITGDLLVQGETTTVNSTTLTVVDPVITLSPDNTITLDNLARGVEFKYGNGTSVLTGFMGLNNTTREFTFISGGATSNVVVPDILKANYIEVSEDVDVIGTLTAGLIDGGIF